MAGLSDFTVAIFSYNRGGYLENCAQSCLANLAGARVEVFDDASDDPATLEVLDRLAAQGCIIHNVQPLEASRHGGLYANMQLALARCTTPYILFLQDDTQVVRPLDTSTADVIRQAFAHPDIAFIRPQFFKQMDMYRFEPHFKTEHVGGVIEPKDSYENCDHDHAYCDVVLGDAALLRAKNWQFVPLERGNQELAKRLFKFMPYLLHPFVFYCPEVPSFRDRRLYSASRIVQRGRMGQIVRFNDWQDTATARLFALKDGEFPVAEDYLGANLPDVKVPFVFQDYARNGWLHALYKVESRLYRILDGTLRMLRLK